MNPTKVAIITRTRNRPLMMPRCIESVLGQDCPDWKHIIVNDGGERDELEAVLDPYRNRYGDRLQVVHNPISLGMQSASNRGIEASQSDYLAIHDDDDSWEPAFLSRCLKRLADYDRKHPGTPAGGVITQINWIVEEIRDTGLVEVWRGDYLPVKQVGLFDAFRRNPTAPIAFLYRRDAHQRLGLYEQKYDVLGDWVFLLELLKEFEVLALDEKLANYHWRSADAVTPEKYANTVTAQLSHHLDLRNRFVNEKLRAALRAVPHLEGPFLAIAQPLLETAETAKAIQQSQQNLAGWTEATTRTLDARFAGILAVLEQKTSREETDRVHEALRTQLVEVRETQLKTLDVLGKVLEELARVKERDYWSQKALDRHSLDLDFVRGTLNRHSHELHETLAKVRNVFKRLRRWEFLLTRDPELHDARTEIEELNQDSFDEADQQSDAPCMKAARHWMAHAEVVSFDVFDTALMRRCGDPWAVFERVNRQLAEAGIDYPEFPRHRREAEHEVRGRNEANGIGDVTLDEIYAQMNATHGLSIEDAETTKQLELETERATAAANPSILQLVGEVLKSGKRVVFISDMYLPKAEVERLLRDAGYPDCPVYVSSVHRVTKHTGELFGVVLEDLGITSEHLLHLGDNRTSDFDMARKQGIRAIHWTGISGGLPLVEQVHPFADWKHKTLTARMAWGLARVRRAQCSHADRLDRFWEMIGYEVAGPAYFNFLSWVIRNARQDGVQSLFFLSRDGYYLTQAFEMIKEARDLGNLEGRYLYASRRLFNLATHGYLDDQVLEFLLSPNPFLRVRDFVERIGLEIEAHRVGLAQHGFKHLNKILTRPTGGFKSEAIRENLAAFFQSIAPEIERLANEEAEQLLAYFHEMGVDQAHTAVVDIGWGASSLLAIQELVGRVRPGHQQVGYYFGTWKFAQPTLDAGCLLKSYFMHLESPPSSCELLTGTIEALEFMFTAPHGSVEGLRQENGKILPVEAAIENESRDLNNLRRMHEAGLDFIRDMLAGGAPVGEDDPVEGGYLQAAFKRFLKNPTRAEAQRYGALKMRDSFGSQSRLRPLAMVPKPRFFKSRAIEEGLHEAYWKNGYAALLRTH